MTCEALMTSIPSEYELYRCQANLKELLST